MRNAAQLQYPIQAPVAESFGRIASNLRRSPPSLGDYPVGSANDADFSPRAAGAATALPTLAANGFDDAAQLRIGRYRSLAAAELNAAARSDRAQRLGALAAAAIVAAVGGLRSLFSRFDRWRREQATVQALQSLDDRTLRDIGLDRSEILSIAREIDHPAFATRAQAARSLHCL